MSETYLRFALLGIASGSLYGLVALGVVVVRRASGVLNFAAGSVGALSAFVTYDLRDLHGVSAPLAVLAGLLVGTALGIATQLVVMRFMRRSSPLTRLIATLGIMTTIQGLIVVIFGSADRGQPVSILPTRVIRLGGSITLTEDRLLLIGIAAILTIALGVVYTRTRFGLATTAVAESSTIAASYGLSPSKIEMLNFAVGGALAAAASILIAPIVGLTQTALVLVIVPALAAALFGRFTSFTLTVLGAVLIGIAQAVIPVIPAVSARISYLSGLPQAVPLVIIVGVTVLRGRSRPARGEAPVRLPLPGTGGLRPAPTLVAAAATLAVVLTSSDALAMALATTFAIAILLLSVVVVTGYAGQLSLAQFALAGFGAWVAARLYATQGWPFVLVLAVAVLITAVAGALVALPALRTRGVDLAVTTLGLALMIESLIFDSSQLTGGYNGTAVPNPTIFGWHIDGAIHPQRYAVVCLSGLTLAALVVSNLRRGRTGRRLLAIRGNERAAASLGVGVYTAKLYAFAISGGLAALAGVLIGFATPDVDFQQFDVFGSISAVEYATVGGIGWIGGTVVGACLAPGALLQEGLSVVFRFASFGNYAYLIAGLAVLTLLLLAPNGIGFTMSHVLRTFPPLRTYRRRVSSSGRVRPVKETHRLNNFPTHEAASVEISDLTIRFGGVLALDALSVSIRPNRVLGVIGPNGAGKTTLLDAITGFTNPSAGRITYDGRSIERWSVEKRSRAGLARTFQAVELFDDLTVLDNLLIAADDQSRWAYARDLVRPGCAQASQAVTDVVNELGLMDLLQLRPTQLSQGQARLVGIARAVCAEPKFLFLDEPAAGLDKREREELRSVIRRLATTRGLAVVLVEHDVSLVTATCDEVLVLDFGAAIAFGAPAEVLTNPAVMSAYIGIVKSDSAAAEDPSSSTDMPSADV